MLKNSFLILNILGLFATSEAFPMCRTVMTNNSQVAYQMTIGREDIRGRSTGSWNRVLADLENARAVAKNVSLSIHPHSIAQGTAGNPVDFNAKISTLDLGPGGNVYLRMLMDWCKLIAQDLGDPLIAGDIFLAIINRAPVMIADRTAIQSREHFVQGIGFGVFESLEDLLRIRSMVEKTNGVSASEDNLLAMMWNSIATVKYLLTTTDRASDFLVVNVQNLLEQSQIPFQKRLRSNGSRNTEFACDWVAWDGVEYKIVVKSNPATDFGATFFVPIDEKLIRLGNLPWIATVEAGGVKIGGLLAVNDNTKRLILEQIAAFQIAARPIIERQRVDEAIEHSQAQVKTPELTQDLTVN